MKKGIFSVMMIAGLSLWAQDVKTEQRYDEVFHIDGTTSLDITNKYGEVIVNVWNRDSIRIKVLVSAEGKSRDAVNKEIRKVDIDLRKIGSIVSGETKIDQGTGKGLLGGLLDQVSDYSQSVISGKKVVVDYEVWLPPETDISIENKFGDIYLATLSGKISIDLSHGDLRGNRLEGRSVISHGFGKHGLDHVEDGRFALRGVESQIESAEIVEFESSSSEITLGKVGYLRIDSRNDRIRVNELKEVRGEGSFTDLEVALLVNTANLDFDYGEVFLNRISKSFGTVAIRSKSCDINLILDQASYIDTSITALEDMMILPNSMLVMKKATEEDGRVSLNGFVGNTNTTHSVLDIEAMGGEVIISIKETDIFTNRD